MEKSVAARKMLIDLRLKLTNKSSWDESDEKFINSNLAFELINSFEQMYQIGFDKALEYFQPHCSHPVVRINKECMVLEYFKSVTHAAKRYSCDRTTIQRSIRKKTKTLIGQYWRYASEAEVKEYQMGH